MALPATASASASLNASKPRSAEGMMADKLDVRSQENGYYDIIYSPHDGGCWYADLLWSRKIPPTFKSAAAAERWAVRQGGKQCLRISA